MYQKINYPSDLPIVEHKDEIINAIREHSLFIVSGATGSGKTTQLPKMCLEAGRGFKKRIGCTQPRRIAAITVAGRVTEELGAAGAELIGYKIRFQDRTRKSNRIKFMTDGILLAETQNDRMLNGYDTIIIDEAHERSLNIDFLLGILKTLLKKRKDLKAIITSATIDTVKFSKNFNNAPVIEVSGRTYPVEVRYQSTAAINDANESSYIDPAVEAVIELRRKEKPGNILIFMPTEQDIRETIDTLNKAISGGPGSKGHSAWPQKTAILPLFGRLAAKDQAKVFTKSSVPKIVVATNVAETSVTVPGIRYVIDTGLARISSYNVRARTTKMPVTTISQASCNQRQGRCGRVGPGICIRLFDEENYLTRPEYTQPEILRSNLAEVILRMISLNLGSPAKFPFVDPPSSRAIKDGFSLLQELGALDQKRRLTARGKLMARLPLDPRISRMILAGRDNNALKEISVIAAALSIQNPRVRPAEKEKEADITHARFAGEGSDFLSLLTLWDAYQIFIHKRYSQSKVRKFCLQNFVSYQRMREWVDIHQQICAVLAEEKGFIFNTKAAKYDAVHISILSGSLRHIAQKKEKNRYRGAQNKEIMIFPGSDQFGKAGQWIMAAEFVETTKLYARTVANIKPEWIEPLAGDLCRSTYSSPHWEKRTGRVVASKKVTLFGLVIVPQRTVNYARINSHEAREIFIQTALVAGELRGRYAFLDHNQQLINRIQDMENRIRDRSILKDEYTLFQFYEQRLPEHVLDRQSLNGFLKKSGSDKILFMTEEDILQTMPDQERFSDYPKMLRAGDFSLQLSYRFDPGAGDDGVSVHIPLDLLGHVPPDYFDWLVPGLLPEKITFLLKGLPKNIRKQLIPIPQTVKTLFAEMTLYNGNLLSVLEDAVYQRFRIHIDRQYWPVAEMPDLYRMRFCLVDSRGNILKISRNFADLAEVSAPPLKEEILLELKKQWEKSKVTHRVLAELPQRIPLKTANNTLGGFAFPTLVVERDNSVALRLMTNEEESRKNTVKGLVALYLGNFPKIKSLKKDFSAARSQWPLYEGVASHEQFNADLYSFIMEEIFAARDNTPPDPSFFEKKLAEVKAQGLYNAGKPIFDAVIDTLAMRRETLNCIAKYEGMAKTGLTSENFSEFRSQAATILPPDFLNHFNLQEIVESKRYLKALCIRIERAHSSPARDTVKATLIVPHEERLMRCEEKLSHLCGQNLAEKKKVVEEYRKMIEEYKLSIFAQELKTAFPISEKRLNAKWQDIKRIF